MHPMESENKEIDIKQLPYLITQLELQQPSTTIPILHSLILSPFEIGELLKKEDFNKLTTFLIKNITHQTLSKTVIRCLALLISKTNNPTDYFSLNYICNTKVEEIAFLRFIKQLSKLNKIDTFDFNITKDDTNTLTKYKLKIMAEQTVKGYFKVEDALHQFIGVIENSFLSWTVAKCMFRVIKCVDNTKIIRQMVEQLNEIFVDENLWIVYSTVFSFLLLSGFEINDLDRIYKNMVFFDRECVFKSGEVRETGLFLLWCIIKSRCKHNSNVDNKKSCFVGYDKYKCDNLKDDEIELCGNNCSIENNNLAQELKDKEIELCDDLENKMSFEDKCKATKKIDKDTVLEDIKSCGDTRYNDIINIYLKDAILVALFDSSLQCRRAASSIILELCGLINFVHSERLIDLINLNSVKRYENSINVVKEVIGMISGIKEDVIKELKKGIEHYKYEKRKIDAINLRIIADGNIFSVQELELESKNGYFMESIFRYANFDSLMIGFNNDNIECNNLFNSLKNIVLRNKIDKNIIDFIKNCIITKQVLDYKNCNQLIEEYLKMQNEYLNIESIRFIMNRNYKCEKYAYICKYFFDVAGFEIEMFKALKTKRSESFIVGNAFNEKFRVEIDAVFKDILEGEEINKKLEVFKVVAIRKEYKKYKEYIVKGLEDYSVDMTGDVGAKIRTICFNLIVNVDVKLFERYFCRFIADKSKALRDSIIYYLTDNVFNILGNWELKRMSFESGGIDKFTLKYKQSVIKYLKTDLSNTEIHFKALADNISVLVLSYRREILYGMINTMKNSDATDFYLLLGITYSLRLEVLELIPRDCKKITREVILLVFIINQFKYIEWDGDERYKIFNDGHCLFHDNEMVYKFIEEVKLFTKNDRLGLVCGRILGLCDTNLF